MQFFKKGISYKVLYNFAADVKFVFVHSYNSL